MIFSRSSVLSLSKAACGVGMHRHGRVTEHRLGARGGDGDMCRLARFGVDHRIIEMPEVTFGDFVEDLVVAHGRLQIRVPIHEPLATVDFVVGKQFEKRLTDRPGTLVVERKAGPLPIATAAKLLELAKDSLLVLGLPLPDAVHQALTTQSRAATCLLLPTAAAPPPPAWRSPRGRSPASRAH